ncbi:MAG: alpha/beta hydrolase [Acidimicrobiales bacterium]
MSLVEPPLTAGEELTIASDGLDLAGYLVRPTSAASPGGGRHGLVLCHGFPVSAAAASGADRNYIELADRLCRETGWVVLTFGFRGIGGSPGNFSLAGWLRDLHAATEALRASPGVDGVWLCGFAAGGSLALCAAGEDPEVRGVAALAAPADFADRAADPRRLVAQARAAGVIRDPAFPPDLDAWARELR